MTNKLKLWNAHPSWESAEKAWDQEAKRSAASHPLKTLRTLPNMPGMTPETAKNLKWKSLKYIVQHDKNRVISRYILKHPLKYGWRFIRSCLQKKPFKRDGDFFLYGLDKAEDLEKRLEDPRALLVVGFSYCHKPLECPSGRFTDQCIHALDSPVCRQCFIGKAVHALPERDVIPLFIPTIHYIGEKIFEILEAHPDREILFLITACEMTLEMFGDFGNMTNIRGIGVRLDGRICNTMKAFELSEEGIKPGLTVVLPSTQERILNILRSLRERSS